MARTGLILSISKPPDAHPMSNTWIMTVNENCNPGKCVDDHLSDKASDQPSGSGGFLRTSQA